MFRHFIEYMPLYDFTTCNFHAISQLKNDRSQNNVYYYLYFLMRLGVNDKNFGCMIFLIYITGSVAKHIKQETEGIVRNEM